MVEINRRLRQRFRIGGALTVSGFGMEERGGSGACCRMRGVLLARLNSSQSESGLEGGRDLGQRTGTTTATETAAARKGRYTFDETHP